MSKLVVSVVQMDLVWANPESNRKRASELIEKAPGADLYLLPEMFSTGFATEPSGIAEAECETLGWMIHTANITGAAVAGSISTGQDGQFYNRFYFVKPDGSYLYYDKRHLFTFSGEHKRYSCGEDRVVVDWKGFKMMLLVCYDLRFPVWSRNLGDYDAILYVASWPVQRIAAWKTLLAARAIENQCYVAAANRVGDDPGNHYSGASMIIDPKGNVLNTLEGAEGVITADFDLDALNAFRDAFPVGDDVDEFQLIR